MATIKKGKYRWNDEVDVSQTFDLDIILSCNIILDVITITELTGFKVMQGTHPLGYANNGLHYKLIIEGEETTLPGYTDNENINGISGYSWYVDTLKWRTFNVATDTEVDDTFATWFEANTSPVSTEVTEASVKAKIQRLITAANSLTGKSDTDLTGAMLSLAVGYGQGGNSNVAAVYGKWRFNETVEKTSIPSYPYLNITQNVNFTTTIEGTVYQCTGMWVCASNFSDPTILEYQGGGVPSVYRGGADHWLYDSARNVDFGAEPQIVDPDFKDWLLANATRISSGEDSPLPIEVASESEMNAILGTAAVGSVYKYTGTSGTYENGALYVVEVSE